jgi:hypothetical protein
MTVRVVYGFEVIDVQEHLGERSVLALERKLLVALISIAALQNSILSPASPISITEG